MHVRRITTPEGPLLVSGNGILHTNFPVEELDWSEISVDEMDQAVEDSVIPRRPIKVTPLSFHRAVRQYGAEINQNLIGLFRNLLSQNEDAKDEFNLAPFVHEASAFSKAFVGTAKGQNNQLTDNDMYAIFDLAAEMDGASVKPLTGSG